MQFNPGRIPLQGKEQRQSANKIKSRWEAVCEAKTKWNTQRHSSIDAGAINPFVDDEEDSEFL